MTKKTCRRPPGIGWQDLGEDETTRPVPLSLAQVKYPRGAVVGDDGTVHVSEYHRIRMLRPDGTVATLAGSHEPDFRDGVGAHARFEAPSGLALARDGALFVADTANHRIRRVARDGAVTTVAGDHDDDSPTFLDGPVAEAQFYHPEDVAVSSDGRTLFVADTGNHRVRQICDGVVSTIAGGFSTTLQPSMSLKLKPCRKAVLTSLSPTLLALRFGRNSDVRTLLSLAT